ncbi:hypothetical protein NI17_001650 [Thermobifida halotolerans]|uniref:Uncharacterized protein n=2 Tax=Thermobifida halotolerans TaxID=483545 RepID=A0A399G2S9_9ACTN|nr:hypothetical protein NI17_001650 [Thermobifida halotolerans]
MVNRLSGTTTAARKPLHKGFVFCAFLAVPGLMTGWLWSGHPLWVIAAGVVVVLTFVMTALAYREGGPHQRVVELYGGPLDGERLDLSSLTEEQIARGVTLPARHGSGRSRYAPDPSGVLRHVGDA